MQIWPAIDLRGGKCVRLVQGDYGREIVFGDDPAAVAKKLVDQGAECLHLVDLDGAREGKPVNLASVQAILDAVEIDCELGGGIRDESHIRTIIDEIGLARIVIGTRPCAIRIGSDLMARATFPANSCWASTPATAWSPPMAG